MQSQSSNSNHVFIMCQECMEQFKCNISLILTIVIISFYKWVIEKLSSFPQIKQGFNCRVYTTVGSLSIQNKRKMELAAKEHSETQVLYNWSKLGTHSVPRTKENLICYARWVGPLNSDASYQFAKHCIYRWLRSPYYLWNEVVKNGAVKSLLVL